MFLAQQFHCCTAKFMKSLIRMNAPRIRIALPKISDCPHISQAFMGIHLSPAIIQLNVAARLRGATPACLGNARAP
jgi:hypothetical protein